MSNKICGIYCIENLVTNKKYIGQSINIYSRWYDHKKYCRNKYYGTESQDLIDDWEKYGENNFKFYILKQCNKDELDKYESYYIQKYFGNLYNKNPGGKYGFNLSEEQKKKMSDSKNELFKNDKFRERYKQVARPILQIDFNGNIVKRWDINPIDIEKIDNQYSMDNIYNCLKGRNKTHCNYIWIYEDSYNKETFNLSSYFTSNIRQNKNVYQYSLNGKLIKIWKDFDECTQNGYNRNSISNFVHGRALTYKKSFWSYHELNNEEINEMISRL